VPDGGSRTIDIVLAALLIFAVDRNFATIPVCGPVLEARVTPLLFEALMVPGDLSFLQVGLENLLSSRVAIYRRPLHLYSDGASRAKKDCFVVWCVGIELYGECAVPSCLRLLSCSVYAERQTPHVEIAIDLKLRRQAEL